MLPEQILARNNLLPTIANNLKYWRGLLLMMSMVLTAVTMLTAVQQHIVVFLYLVTMTLSWLSLVWPLSYLHLSVTISALISIAVEAILFLMSVYLQTPHPVIRGLVRSLAAASLYFVAYISHKTYKVMDILERLEAHDNLEADRQRQVERVRRLLERNALV